MLEEEEDIIEGIQKLWDVMRECIFLPAKKNGALPGVWMYSAVLLPWLKNFTRSKQY